MFQHMLSKKYLTRWRSVSESTFVDLKNFRIVRRIGLRGNIMKSLFSIIIFLVLRTSCLAYESPKIVPSEIIPFEDLGSRIIEYKQADLNGDGIQDYLIILEVQKKETLDPDIDQKRRSVLILIRQQDNSLKLVKRNNNLAACSTCGGTFVDGFAELLVYKREFSISNHSGGNSASTAYTYTFAYSRRENTWQLIRVETKQEELSKDKEYKYVMKPPNDFGKIDFADFDSDLYLGQGDGYTPRKRAKNKVK